MEPEGSVPHSQVCTNCPYLEPAWSSPHPYKYATIRLCSKKEFSSVWHIYFLQERDKM